MEITTPLGPARSGIGLQAILLKIFEGGAEGGAALHDAFYSLLGAYFHCEAAQAPAADRAGELLEDVALFDVYTGKGIPENKKSLALRVVMQDTQRTLLDSEVDAALQNIASELENKFAAQLRA